MINRLRESRWFFVLLSILLAVLVWMYVREKNKEIVELVILVGGKEEFMLMSFCGVIDLKKISRLAKAVNVEGMEYLGKVKK